MLPGYMLMHCQPHQGYFCKMEFSLFHSSSYYGRRWPWEETAGDCGQRRVEAPSNKAPVTGTGRQKTDGGRAVDRRRGAPSWPAVTLIDSRLTSPCSLTIEGAPGAGTHSRQTPNGRACWRSRVEGERERGGSGEEVSERSLWWSRWVLNVWRRVS